MGELRHIRQADRMNALEGAARAQHQGVPVNGANHLKADRQAL
jgi:hypothetical protein